jgi:type I site-specific restriction-modification system R (restriction) subunit
MPGYHGKLIDFEHPEKNTFHAINQFRVETPGCVKKFIIPDIVLFVNGIPLVVCRRSLSKGEPFGASEITKRDAQQYPMIAEY